MIATEAILLTTLMILLIVSGYTDCKNSIVANRLLIVGILVSFPTDILYYYFWGRPYLPVFLLNLILLTAVSAVFYCYHLWAAGDSKLLFVVGLLIPGRFYTFGNVGPASGFTIIVFTFSIAFIFVIMESAWLILKNHVKLKLAIPVQDCPSILVSYFAMVAATTVLNCLLFLIPGNIFTNNPLLIAAVNFLAVLSFIQLRYMLSTKLLLASAAILWGLLLAMWFGHLVDLSGIISPRSWLIVLVMIMCRWMAERFNYQSIPTTEVRAGQILSAATIINFTTSRVQGLPTGMTEDLRSRITEDEAESVRRWATSAQGKENIIIVRKIPFAVFIGVGTLCFFVFEVAMR